VNLTKCNEVKDTLQEFMVHLKELPFEEMQNKKFILIANKTDMLVKAPDGFKSMVEMECLFVSAKRKENINLILDSLAKFIEDEKITDTTVVTNTRHYDALNNLNQSISAIKKGFSDNIPSDLIASDIRNALHYLGEITGEVTTNEILDNIFSRFCIGK
jgi:tRNA modification GTPase